MVLDIIMHEAKLPYLMKLRLPVWVAEEITTTGAITTVEVGL